MTLVIVFLVILDFMQMTLALIYDIKTEINELMNNVDNWMNVNKLTLNFSKSNILLIILTGFDTEKVCLFYDTNWSTSFKLLIVENTKYLVVMFDKNLSFDCHINKLLKNY